MSIKRLDGRITHMGQQYRSLVKLNDRVQKAVVSAEIENAAALEDFSMSQTVYVRLRRPL